MATVGSGSYVQKAGDSMTGPLTLSSDPTAPYQAASRHYVDNGLAAKANLVNGLVPAVQLGIGTAAGNTCLKGDSSWGACGISSDAVSIQGVPVDSGAPSDGQVITYELASGKYKPKAGGGELPTYTGDKTITGNLTMGGNATISGQLSVAGPYNVESDISASALTVASAGKSKIGFDTDGKLKVSENARAVTEVAKINSPVTAAQLPALTGDVTSAGGTAATTIASGVITDAKVNAANKEGSGTKFAMTTGAFSSGGYRSSDANGNSVDSGVTAGPACSRRRPS